MQPFLQSAGRHWPFSMLFLSGLVAAGLQLLQLHLLVDIILTLAAAGMALIPLVDSYTRWQTGHLRLNVLVAITVTTATIQRQFWIAYAAAIVYYLGTLMVTTVQRRVQRSELLPVAAVSQQVDVVRGRKLVNTAISDLQLGDKIIWASGTVLPVDATIIEGNTLSDETGLMAGAAEPRAVTVGEALLSGSRNTGSPVTVKVHSLAEASYLQTTTQLLAKSVGEQTLFVHHSDGFSLYLTLSSLLIAGAAWFLGHSAHRFLAVLTVATITPVLIPARLALAVAMSKAASRGIVFRSGPAIEKLAAAKTVAFGFSGIITSQQPVIASVTAVQPYTQNEILGLAASLEQAVDHPLANAIVAAATAQGFNFIKAKHVQLVPGQGLKASLQGKEVLVGNASLLIEQAIPLPVKVAAKDLVVYVAHHGQLAGTIKFQLALRPSTRPTFTALRQHGVQLLQILSAAPRPAVEAATAELKPVDVHAGLPLAEKLAVLATASQRPVVYVGQAADTTLLTAADVGITLGTSSRQAASTGSSILVLAEDLAYVAVARRLSDRAFASARQSIVLGTVLSLGFMVLALGGKLPLLVGLGLQFTINLLVTVYPLLASQKS